MLSPRISESNNVSPRACTGVDSCIVAALLLVFSDVNEVHSSNMGLNWIFSCDRCSSD